jgi:hypothetical protein
MGYGNATLSKDDDDDDDASTDIDDSDIYRALKAATQTRISAGTLLRAGSALAVSPFLLRDQFLHKSTILILQETEAFSVGLVLNLPTTDSYTVEMSNGRSAEFTIRYGGTSGGGSDEDNGEETLVWLHCSKELKHDGIGKPLGGDSGVWTCSVGQVVDALESGLAGPGEFILVQGFCVWEKEAAGSGGVLGQVMDGKFEPLAINDDIVDGVWCKLLTQNRLEEDSLTTNYQKALEAWTCSSEKHQEPDSSRLVFETDVKVSSLADEALLVWIKIFLLGNAEYYVPELSF